MRERRGRSGPVTASVMSRAGFGGDLGAVLGESRGFAREGAMSRACFRSQRRAPIAILPLEIGKPARDRGAMSRAGFGPL